MAKSKQNKDENKNFVLTLPIKMNVCDEHILDKRYEYFRQIYNIAQRRLLNQFMYFAVTKEYKSIKTIKEKKDFFKTHPFKIKGYDKSIANHAPSEFITILENKVVSLGGKFEKVDIKNSASRFDFTNETFNEHNVGVRKITLSNGNIHQRDMLASFNLQHLVIPNENLKEYDVEQMKLDYPIYCKLEKQEIALHKNGNKKQYKSVIGKW